jgi:hypothetical protein
MDYRMYTPLSLKQIINMIKNPAGNEFDTLEKVTKNRDKFIKAFHDGYKELHYSLIDEIMIFESAKENFLKEKLPNKRIIKDLNEFLLILRRANDCIAWVMVGMDRHIIRRLCLRHTRGNLKDQNPGHALAVLEKLNSIPMNLGIWNDATSCIDVGDILLLDRENSRISCIELKEGIVNETIDQIIASGCKRAMYFFLKEYGEKGKKQFERTLKQTTTHGQAMELLDKEVGYDPTLGQRLIIKEVETPDEIYHKELNNLINDARKKDYSITLIDKCLWLFAFDHTRFTYLDMINEFSKKVLQHDDGQLKKWLFEFHPKKNSSRLYPIHNLLSGLKIPEALPIFSFIISSSNILDILLNKIVVFMFLDWDEFSNLFKEKEIKLTWSTKKAGRREKVKPILKRPFLIGDRVPILQMKEFEMWIGPGVLTRIFFDGIRPRCIVNQEFETLKWMIKMGKNQLGKWILNHD